MYRCLRTLHACLFALLALALAATAQADPAAPAASASLGAGMPADVLGPGDAIRVTVFNNPDLTTETRLSPQGFISMPLIGQVELKGLSPSAAEARIAQRLKAGQFLKDPQVSINVMDVRSREVSVLGQVARPGRYTLDERGTRVTDALALAGGITPLGDERVTLMTRRDGHPEKLVIDVSTVSRSADRSGDVEVKTGDTIFVDKAPVFYIYGEVNKPGAYPLQKGLSVVQALSLGGGITVRGTERGMKINRRAPDGTLQKIDAQPADKVQPDDVIYVSESLF